MIPESDDDNDDKSSSSLSYSSSSVYSAIKSKSIWFDGVFVRDPTKEIHSYFDLLFGSPEDAYGWAVQISKVLRQLTEAFNAHHALVTRFNTICYSNAYAREWHPSLDPSYMLQHKSSNAMKLVKYTQSKLQMNAGSLHKVVIEVVACIKWWPYIRDGDRSDVISAMETAMLIAVSNLGILASDAPETAWWWANQNTTSKYTNLEHYGLAMDQFNASCAAVTPDLNKLARYRKKYKGVT